MYICVLLNKKLTVQNRYEITLISQVFLLFIRNINIIYIKILPIK